MSRNKNSGIQRVFPLNIGTIIFGILFIYIIVSIFLYVTATHVRSYQVTSGPLAENQTYCGLAVYTEKMVSADTSGYVSYYTADHSKVKNGGVVYGISPNKKSRSSVKMTRDTLNAIQNDMRDFSTGFDPTDFHDVYSLKYTVEGEILNQSLAASVSSNSASDSAGAMTLGNETIKTSDEDGIVVYASDGYENFDISKLTKDSLDEKSYHLTSLKTDKPVRAGDHIYKLIESENWSLIIPLTSRQVVRLADHKTIRVKFLKDGNSQTAALSILTMKDGSYFGKLDFTGGLSRYLDSRFVDVELVTNTQIGLKVPVSSIVSKRFYTIPDEYGISTGSGGEVGFLKASSADAGSSDSDYITTTVYEHKNGNYYVDSSDFSTGDIILKEGSSSDRFIVGNTETLEGVYSMNKGYAEFRRVNIIDKNEEYCIVKKGTSYGISQFDNIVLDASSVKESQITAAQK